MTGKSLILGLTLFFAAFTPLFSQPCDCVSTGNCPVPITDNGTFNGMLDVTVNGTNDLGVNPLTSVCFTITHTWIGDLSVSLTSPSGLHYMLMADVSNNYGGCGTQQDNAEVCIVVGTGNPLTNNTEYQCNSAPCSVGTCCLNGNWNVACGGVTDPLTGALQAPNCNLNDFNIPGHPANGTWTLTVNDVCNMDTGVLQNFSLTFANGTQSCIACEANGGTLDSISVVGCYGDPDLLLDIPPNYGAGSGPDTASYGYTYVISQNGIVVAVDSEADFTGQPEGVYVVCGLSYYIPDSAKLNMLIGLDTAMAFSQVGSATAPFCGDFSNNCITVTILPVIPPTMINASVCQGDCITVGGQPVCASDTLTLQSWRGCDSVVMVKLTPILPDTVDQNVTVCQGGCTTVGGQSYCAPGPYYVNLQTWQGCDSVVHLTFTELVTNAVINPANPAAITCTTSSVTLDGSSSAPSGATFAWSGPGGFSSSQTSITAIQPGTYTLTITDNTLSPACTSTASVMVANGILPPDISVVGPTPQVCAGASFDLSTLNIQDANNTNPVITFHSGTPATTANKLSSTTVSPAATTMYYILATKGSCKDEISVTLNVLTPPTSDISVTSPVCVGEAALVSHNGTATSSAIFTWDFDGGTATPGTGGGMQSVVWVSPGVYTVTLVVEENGCISPMSSQMITVEGPIQAPQISCTSTTSSVEFTWADVPGATSYNVTLLSGTAGTYNSSTNTYLVTGLNPGDQVSIEVEAVTGNVCGNTTATQTCAAQNCQAAAIAIQPVSNICRTAATPAFNLSANVSGGNGGGSLTWSGNGITNASAGTFDPNQASLGANTIVATYTEGNCVFTEQIIINVYQTPGASFTATSPVCVSDAATVTFTGSGSGLTYTWDFAGGTATPGTGAGPHQVTWAGGGNKTVTLTVTNANGCASTQVTGTVVVENPLPAPVITCSSTTSSVLFSWNAIPGASGYNVTVLSGQSGTQPSPTSFEITGLSPAEQVEIEVEAISTGACGNSSSLQTCSAQDCPVVTIVIDPVSDICRSAASLPFNLTATTTGTSSNGTLTWPGSGITDPAAGTFNPSQAMVGANFITLTYQEGNCIFSENITINVYDTPVASFTAPSSICQGDAATVAYTGTTSTGLTYTWDFGGGAATPGTGAGPHSVTWPSSGAKTISLTVQSAEGCVSQPVQKTVQVGTPLQAPVITCTSTTTSIEFSWSNVPGAGGYTVVIPTGQSGTQTAPTKYLLTNLQPSETVDFQLTVNSADACPAITVTSSCMTEPCPSVAVDVLPVADFCLGTAAPVQLTVDVTGSDSSGSGTWSGPGIINGATGTFSPTAAGFGQHKILYTFIEKSCTFKDSITIGVYQQPSSNFTADAVICSDKKATVTFTGTAGAGATYTWNFDGGAAVPGVGPGPHQVSWTTPGMKNISLTVSQSGCTSAAFTQQVQVDEALETPGFTCDATTESVIFTWDAVANSTGYTVDVLAGPAGTQVSPTSYEMTGLDPGQAVSIQLTVNGNTACPEPVVKMDCAALPCPNITIAIESVAPLCLTGPGGPVELTAHANGATANGHGSWSGPGIIDPDLGIFDKTAAGVGTHTLTFTHQEANCTYTETLDIEVLPPPTADAGEDARLTCWEHDQVVDLGGPGTSVGANITYLWIADFGDFPGVQTIRNPQVTVPGTYTLVVSNGALGCSAMDTVVVEASQDVPVPAISVSPMSCHGNDDAFVAINSVSGGEEPYYFSLNGAPYVSADTFPYLSPGNYELSVMDASGCESSVNFTINDPGVLTVDLTANLVGKNLIKAGESIQLVTLVSLPVDSIDLVQWSHPDLLDCDDCLDPVATPFETTTFIVTVNSNGCEVSDNLTIFVEDEVLVYVPNAFSPNGDGTNDVFMIYAGPKVTRVKSFLVFDRWGEKVYQFEDFDPKDPSRGWDGTFRGQLMNQGVFVWFAEIELTDGSTKVLEGDVTLVR
jgi:gliding motility-associated-like protein